MLSLSAISKGFPGVKALDKVDFSCRPGEIHALLGENGAGKSTLIKVIGGVYSPDAGRIEFGGHPVRWDSPIGARDAGIHVIHQELVLFPELSVAENIFVGQEPVTRFGVIDYVAMRRRSVEILERLGAAVSPDLPVKNLTVADQQMVEIAKALTGKARLLVLDEPTAVISGREVDLLFDLLRGLRDEGTSIIYVSHRLEEIFEIADRVTVLKDGCLVGTKDVREIDRGGLVAMMVGRDISEAYPPRAGRRGAPLIEVDNLVVGDRVKGVSLTLCEGEILGLAGMVGSGRTELAQGIFGGLPVDRGRVAVAGRADGPASPRRSIAAGLGFLTEDRKGEGLMLGMDVTANITAPALQEFSRLGFLNLALEREACLQEVRKFSIAVPSLKAKVVNLSGGNQQKVLFSRWLRACDKALILDEPTRGVDVGAKMEIYDIMRRLTERGIGILMISSELLEVVGMCDRVLVMCEGVITGELEGDEVTEEAIMHLAMLHTRDSQRRAAAGSAP